ncbi:hypothetical protein SAMN05444422_101224 [Halobiforma haloterrestris]|uniref:Uncharacterized protein n=1 Tax=Natronobacterium haloterrestre TaxID=148448 RepID=A0A1I1D2F5_NATHA|nr:hypothetical protein [Halobiforma haloterrestris]SFB69179.1 hypothetical protein SAMN05444422_101224 [Halobiforma haloterrestris]
MDEDKYTRLVLEGSEYELLRARWGMFSRWSIPQKIRGCSFLLFAASAMFPIMFSLPGAVQERYLGVDVAASQVGFTALTLFSVGCLVGSSVGLAVLAGYRDRLDDISERQAWSLVGIEDLFSGLGLVTGLLGVVATLVLAAIGHAGVETIDALVASGVRPYRAGPRIAVTVAAASGIAFCCAITVFVLGTFTESFE